MEKDKKTLLIFDPHQDLQWIKNILNKEVGNFEQLLFGGDWFDTFLTFLNGDRQLYNLCKYIIELNDIYGSNLLLTLGNHDSHYFYDGGHLRCSGYEDWKLPIIRHTLGPKIIAKHKIMHFVNGYIITHAGVHKAYWYPSIYNDRQALQKFQEKCNYTMDCLRRNDPNSALLNCGIARNGNSNYGGPLWLDFNVEFEDELPYPQICGHTGIPQTEKIKGRSYCLDACQKVYAILYGKKLEVKKL